MKRRVFSRRRHAEIKARFWLRLCAWIGIPAALAVIGLESVVQGVLPTAGASAFAVVTIAYSTLVFRLHDLTGELRFF